MNKIMKEYLKNLHNEEENLKAIKSKTSQPKQRKVKLINLIAVVLVVVVLGCCSPHLYAKAQENKKYQEYIRRNYVSGKGEIATAYSETIDMDYVYQNDIGVKIDSLVLTDDTFKANLSVQLPEEMRLDKLEENKNEAMFFQFGFVVYDEENNILGTGTRLHPEKSFKAYSEYLTCLYKELGIKYKANDLIGVQLNNTASGCDIERLEDKIICQIKLNSVKGFPNSKKIYIRIWNMGYTIIRRDGTNTISEYNDLEWKFEIETPDKFIKRETSNLVLEENIPKLKITHFSVSETGMVLVAQKKDVIDVITEGMTIENWGEVQDDLLNITDEFGYVYYPVNFGTAPGKNGFYARFEIDKDIIEETTLYLNMKIGEKEYSSEIIIEE